MLQANKALRVHAQPMTYPYANLVPETLIRVMEVGWRRDVGQDSK